MNKNRLYIDIYAPGWEELLPDIEDMSQNIFEHVMRHLDIKKEVSANLLLSNDEDIKKLNHEFRNINKPTNILSFPSDDTDGELGDMIIALETMENESKEFGIELSDHYTHLLIHGILHLLAYDHVTPEQAKEMEDLEIKLLKNFNIDNPYEEEN